MRHILPTLSMLPGIAFATLPTTGETVAICLGDHSYYRVATTKTAAELNAMYGVTEAQAQAMVQVVGLEAGSVPASDAAAVNRD
jgi:hypothetical protein